MLDGFHVFCWTSEVEGSEGEHVLATRQRFPTRASAETYAKTIDRHRCPFILPRNEVVKAAVQSRDCSPEWLRTT
jgi:hypothetical protein